MYEKKKLPFLSWFLSIILETYLLSLGRQKFLGFFSQLASHFGEVMKKLSHFTLVVDSKLTTDRCGCRRCNNGHFLEYDPPCSNCTHSYESLLSITFTMRKMSQYLHASGASRSYLIKEIKKIFRKTNHLI